MYKTYKVNIVKVRIKHTKSVFIEKTLFFPLELPNTEGNPNEISSYSKIYALNNQRIQMYVRKIISSACFFRQKP